MLQLEFRNVDFRYSEDGRLILKGISFELEAGKNTVAQQRKANDSPAHAHNTRFNTGEEHQATTNG